MKLLIVIGTLAACIFAAEISPSVQDIILDELKGDALHLFDTVLVQALQALSNTISNVTLANTNTTLVDITANVTLANTNTTLHDIKSNITLANTNTTFDDITAM